MSSELTLILERIAEGNEQAINDLVPLVYDQMRKIAANALRRESKEECDPTELVHEAYLRLIGNENLAWESRSHFYGACAVVIRRILVDQARARKSQKRGGDQQHVSFDLALETAEVRPNELLELHDALEELALVDPMKAQLVEMRFFGGLQFQEIAQVLELSSPTINRHWRLARAWLYKKLSHEEDSDPQT